MMKATKVAGIHNFRRMNVLSSEQLRQWDAATMLAQGIGAVAQRLLAEQLHDEGVVRVEASTDVENIAEQRSLAKAGFRLEGVIRGAQMRADGRHDIQGWSHLPGD